MTPSADRVASLGAEVRRVRRQRGLTQATLAEAAHVSRAFVIDLERGHARAELGKVTAVLGALALDLVAVPQAQPLSILSAEERTEALAEIFAEWERGRSLPDEDTQRIVRDYAAGALSLDDALAQIDALPAPTAA